MAKLKQHKYLIVALLSLIVISGAYFLLFYLPDRKRRGYVSQSSSVAKSTSNAWRDDSFPLSRGSSGKKVAQLQRYLKIEDDGKWGSQTEAAFAKSGIASSKTKLQLTQEYYYAYQIDQK